MKHFKKIWLLAIIALLTCGIYACGIEEESEISNTEIQEESEISDNITIYEEDETGSSDTSIEENELSDEDDVTDVQDKNVLLVEEAEYYYDVEHVVLYLDTYGHLPYNYITKKEAKALGWNGGQVADYKEGAAIGGDYFGNYENKLPQGNYKECDIDTINWKNRGSRRLIYSDESDYYYTTDHYESFQEIIVSDGQIFYGKNSAN